MDNKQIHIELRKLAKANKHAEVADLQAMATRLRELEGFNSREIKLLVDAAKADVLEDLSTPADGAVQGLLRERLASRILSESDATYEEARWAVETWAKALSGKATEVAHAQPARPSLSWDEDETATTPNLSDLRTSAPPAIPSNALPAYAAPAAAQQAVQPAASASWPPPALSYTETAGEGENTSGTDGGMPLEIAGFRWNWGACLLNCWWLIFNGMPVWGVLMLVGGFIPFVGFLNLIGAVYLGANGHRLAWHRRRFESVEQYIAVQRVWMRWGIALYSISLALIICAFFTGFIGGYEHARARAEAYRQYEATHPAP